MASSILGPITKVPYDVLAEIFVHCLPQRRLEHRQPDTTFAPILLCHVCSTWRTVALAATTLWTYLSCRLTVDGERSRFEDGNWIVRKNEYEFLLWWKKNQRSVAPYLCLALDSKYPHHSETDIDEPVHDSEMELDPVGMISLFEYISSAKYLETNELYWLIVTLRIQRGYPITYPVPHTLVVSNWLKHFDFFYEDQVALVLHDRPSALRHLYLNGEIHIYDVKIPTHWSSLTHLAFFVSEMSLDYWYSLIRAVPQLQLGRFQIDVLDDDDDSEPTPFTLAHLSTLSVSVDVTHDNLEHEFPLAMLLAALHLPALRDLSLCSAEEWYDHHGIDHIYAVLDAAPDITTLTLGPSFLTLQKDEEYLVETLPRIKNTEPIWRRAPRLVHLRLVAENPVGEFEKYTCERRDAFVRNLFHSGSCWLDLNDAACPLQSITIVDRQASHPQANSLPDHTRSCIQEYAGRSPNVNTVFDVIFETPDQAVAGAWNEWGPNLQ